MLKKTVWKSFSFLLFFSAFQISAQQVVSSAGNSYASSTLKFDFTLGEVVTFTGSSANNIVTQGFHQPVLNVQPFFADNDGDGFGNPNISVNATTAPVGYVADNTDCNDNNAGVNPGATEICNGIDDNCNSIVDDVFLAFQPTFFPQGSWNLYAFNSMDYSSNYAGYYNSTGSGVNTGTQWAVDASPSSAPGWNGCSVNIDNHTYSIKRQGFPTFAGGSTIVLTGWDDDVEIFVNGTSVYTAGCCGNTYVSAWSGALDATSTIEVRIKELGGASLVSFDVVQTIPGCTDANACNYDASATSDDGSCVFPSLAHFYDFDADGYGSDNYFGSTFFCTPQGAPWYLTNTDCDDNNAAKNPGAVEICNGIDDNCDGQINEGVGPLTVYYADADGDGYGNGNQTINVFLQGGSSASVSNGSLVIVGSNTSTAISLTGSVSFVAPVDATYSFDWSYSTNDEGAFFDPAYYINGTAYPLTADFGLQIQSGTQSVNVPAGGTFGFSVVTFDDLFGSATLTISNFNGFSLPSFTQACSQPAGYALVVGDCNDAVATTYPGATELCNSIDDNCDTQIDEGVQALTYYADADGDGYGAMPGMTTQGNSTVIFTSTGLIINGSNEQLSGLNIQGGAQFVVPADGVYTFDWSYSTNDVDGPNLDPAYYINGLPVVLTDDFGADNQSGSVSVNVTAGSTFGFEIIAEDNVLGEATLVITNFNALSNFTGVQSCTPIVGYVTVGGDCNDNLSGTNPAASEICNTSDDDCDGSVDDGIPLTTYYQDMDFDGFGGTNSVQSCFPPSPMYVAQGGDCEDFNPTVNPGATEVCNGIDDNCSGIAEEGLTFTDYYADADSDGYGAGTAVNACSQPSGFVTTNTDCNNNNAAVNPGATELCATSVDDNCNGLINEGCLTPGENPSNATSITSSIWPACSAVSGTLIGASASSSALTVCLTGEDKWHQFVATSEGVSIVVNSTAADIVIELQTAAGVLVAQENAVAGLGGEILNHYGLTAGQVYKVGVRNFNSALGTGTYSICAKMLKRGGCDYGPGPYTLCQYFKATWAGAAGTSYTFTFTGTNGPGSGNVYTRTQNSDICILSNVLPTLPYGSAYNVLISNTFTINNGAGVPEVITVPALAPCSMNTVAQPVTALRASDRCTVGPRFRGSVVASLPWVCGANNWRWEFTELNAQGNPVGLPIIKMRGAASNFLNLGTVLQLQFGKTYSVRTAPIFSYTSTNYQWGTPFCLSIVGSAGMIADGSQANDQTVKVETTDEFNMSLYPNPTHGTDVNINLSGIDSDNVQIRVVDAMGRQVWSNRYVVNGMLNTNITFERPLANGLYMVEAIFNGEVQTQRMMVQK